MPTPPPYRCQPGDAREDAPYRAALAGARARLMLTDPPYCLLTRRRKGGDLRDPRKGVKIDREPVVRFESVRDYRHFTEAWMRTAAAHLTEDATLVVWTNLLGKEPIEATARTLGFTQHLGEYVWGKRTTDKNQNEQLLRVYEVALVFARTAPPPPAPDAPAVPWAVVAGYDDEGEAGAWGDHPHHKPFGVLEPLVRAWSRPGDWVLDPFAGSGSCPVAALRLGRRPACIELRPDWARSVSERLAKTPAP